MCHAYLFSSSFFTQQTQEAFLVVSLTKEKAFATSPWGARGEKRKRTVLASSRKRSGPLPSQMELCFIYFLLQKKIVSSLLLGIFLLFLRLRVQFVETNLP